MGNFGKGAGQRRRRRGIGIARRGSDDVRGRRCALLAYAAEFIESGNVWPDSMALPGDSEKSMGRDFSFYLRRNLAEDLAEIGAAA
jgi:hypothetical protein